MKHTRPLRLILFSLAFVVLASSLAWGNGFTLETRICSPRALICTAFTTGARV